MAVTNPDGSIILKTAIDTLGAEKGLNTLKSGISKFTKAMGAVGVAGASAVAMITKTAVEGYAEYEQLIGGAELMFGKAYDTVAKNAQEAYKTVQMSQNEYLQQVNGFATGLKTALGGNEQAAAELSHKIIKAEADIIAATGNTQENVANAFAGIMKSNFTMLDNLQIGITPTKEGFQEVIDKVNEWNKTNGEATNYQMGNLADMQSALVDYIDMVGMSGYAQAEASKTIQGSLASTKAAWQNLLVGMADEEANFEELINNFVGTIAGDGTEENPGLIGNIIPRIKIALSGIVDLIGGLAPEIIKNLPKLIKNIVPEAINAVFSIIKAVVDALPQLIGFFIESFPKLIPQLINGLFDLFELLMNNFEKIIMPIIDALPLIIETLLVATIKRLPQIIVGLTKIVVSLAKATPTIFASFVKSAVNVFETLWENIKKVFSNVKGFFGGIWGSIKNVFVRTGNAIADAISGAVRGAINRVLSYAGRIINNFINGINTAISVINAIPGVSISKLNSLEIPQLAKGAVIPGGKPFLAMLGDQPSGQTNIEAPLDTIVEAVKIALGGSNGTRYRIEVPVYLGNRLVTLAVREGENELGTETVVGGFANAY